MRRKKPPKKAKRDHPNPLVQKFLPWKNCTPKNPRNRHANHRRRPKDIKRNAKGGSTGKKPTTPRELAEEIEKRKTICSMTCPFTMERMEHEEEKT
jgi:hypothetical protein